MRHLKYIYRLRVWAAYSRLQCYNIWKGSCTLGTCWRPELGRDMNRSLAITLLEQSDSFKHQNICGFCLRYPVVPLQNRSQEKNPACMLCCWSGKRDPGVKQWVIQADGLVTCWPLDKDLIVDVVNTRKRVIQSFLSISSRWMVYQGASLLDWHLLVSEEKRLHWPSVTYISVLGHLGHTLTNCLCCILLKHCIKC